MAYNPNQPRDPVGSETGGEWTADGSVAGNAARSAAGLNKAYQRVPVLASEISGVIPQRDGRPVPVQTKTMYHVTRKENVDDILESGFKLEKVNPRWTNDYAVSLTDGTMADAMKYFTPTSDGAIFNTEKYSILEVIAKGRFYKDSDNVNYSFVGARGWMRMAIKDGWDGQGGRNTYIYNVKSIVKIREVGRGD